MIENNTQRKNRFYQSALWRNTRKYYKMYHPLCDCCIVDNKVSSTKEIHHLIPFDDQIDEENVICLCSECHHNIHSKRGLLDVQQKRVIDQKRQSINQKYFNKGKLLNMSDICFLDY